LRPAIPNLFCSEAASDGATTNIFSIEVDSGRTEQLGAVRGLVFLIAVAQSSTYFSIRFTLWDPY
jgi:hypothetical protein